MTKQKILSTLLFSITLAVSNYTYASQENSQESHQVNKTDISWVPVLDKALQTGQFAEARRIANSENKAAVIERLRPWAESGLTPAQWIYAEVLDNAGFSQDSANWAYIAFFNTRFDSHLCKNTEVPNLEKSIIMSFNKTVSDARINREVMTNAINEAINFINQSNNSVYISNKHPEWICYMLPNNTKEITISGEDWHDVYQTQLNNFLSITNSTPKNNNNDY